MTKITIDALHGFNRNASHTEGRYVCECEGWSPDDGREPVDGVVMREGLPTLVRKSDVKPTDGRLYTHPAPAQPVSNQVIEKLDELAAQPVPQDGWLQDGGLLYRLTDGKKPVNRDEINVTMADGFRTPEARARRAGELLDRIRSTSPAQPALKPLTQEQRQEVFDRASHRLNANPNISWRDVLVTETEAAHGIKDQS